MLKNNKRVVVMLENKSGQVTSPNDPFFVGWQYMVESFYGVWTANEICQERVDSVPYSKYRRSLYLINYFGSVTKMGKLNDAAELLKIIGTCQQQGLANGRLPNFIAVDFVDQGNAIDAVNIINAEAARRYLK